MTMGNDPKFTALSDQPLIPELPQKPSFAQRIQRAHDLVDRYPSAGEILTFYAQVAFYQQHVFDCLREDGPQLKQFPSQQDSVNKWPLHTELLLKLLPGFARSLGAISPAPMSDRAAEVAVSHPVEQEAMLTRFWEGFVQDSPESPAADRFLALAFLQPYAEWLVEGRNASDTWGHATCPICDSGPICAVLRDRGHGAGRSLVCSLCMQEWTFPRVSCLACGEERFESLPVFTPQEVPQVRVDACDTCHNYIKTVDMTRDGLAVPIVDELASLSLDLWAAENGYQKLIANLAGI